MNVKLGDGLTVLAMTSDGALNGVDVQIVGIVNSGVAEMDARYLRITLPAAQRLLQSDRVTNLVVGLDSTDNTDRVTAELAPRLRGLPQQMVLKKWIDLATYYKQVNTMFNGIFLFMGVIVFFMVLMSSVNTLLMTMFERTREIGTMLAMGTPRTWIVALFMLEATLLGTMGAIVGVVGGQSARRAFERLRPAFAAAAGVHASMPFMVLHVPAQMIGSSLLVIVSHGAGIHPAGDPRIPVANCGGSLSCLRSIAYCAHSCCSFLSAFSLRACCVSYAATPAAPDAEALLKHSDSIAMDGPPM